jgi:hypothetical protein
MDKEFSQGEVVRSNSTFILGTGPGGKEVGYPCFAGVVIKEEADSDWAWDVGFYSDSWTLSVFEKTDIDLKAIIPSN